MLRTRRVKIKAGTEEKSILYLNLQLFHKLSFTNKYKIFPTNSRINISFVWVNELASSLIALINEDAFKIYILVHVRYFKYPLFLSERLVSVLQMPQKRELMIDMRANLHFLLSTC